MSIFTKLNISDGITKNLIKIKKIIDDDGYFCKFMEGTKTLDNLDGLKLKLNRKEGKINVEKKTNITILIFRKDFELPPGWYKHRNI